MSRAMLVLPARCLAACSSSTISTPPTPAPGETPAPAVVTITGSGVAPQVAHVFFDRKATFINADTRPHAIFSDTHPAHTNCGGILNLGMLEPGQERVVMNLPLDVCFFHEETDPANAKFKGLLVVH